MRVLIIGGGGREHALAWKISQSPLLKELYCAPGNAGIAGVAECLDIQANDSAALKQWALEHKISLVVIGPEGPLASGLADELRSAGLSVFGPGAAGARLESSKAYAKDLMHKFTIPTADYAVFTDYEQAEQYMQNRPEGPVVVKADGLAAGKGVTVASTKQEALDALASIMADKNLGAAGAQVVIEEFLTGQEVSVLAVTDGKNLTLLPSAQDHKTVGEGDRGPNTGGMGAYCPAPIFTEELSLKVTEQVFKPLLKGFCELGIDYRGVIYAGLMVTGEDFKVLEFNARFGDPETQAILPCLQSDLLPLLLAAAEGDITGVKMEWRQQPSVCVVMTSAGYPGPYETGFVISGLDTAAAAAEGLTVFHAGSAFRHGNIVTAGGRVLGVTAWDTSLSAAVDKAYRAVEMIKFEGCYYRRDIAHRALKPH